MSTLLSILFFVFAFGVAADLLVRIVVYSKTKEPAVKHKHFWWKEVYHGNHS